MKKYLITATTGTGKSSVSQELSKMGYESYDIEEVDGMCGMYRKDTKEPFKDFDIGNPEHIKNGDWVCNIEKLKELLSQQNKEEAFYFGIAARMEDIVPFFDKVFMLVIDKENLYKRLSNREGQDDMGGSETSRQAVLGWKDLWEEEMRKLNVIEILAEGSPKEVAEKILKVMSD